MAGKRDGPTSDIASAFSVDSSGLQIYGACHDQTPLYTSGGSFAAGAALSKPTGDRNFSYNNYYNDTNVKKGDEQSQNVTITLSSIVGPSDQTQRQSYYISLFCMIICGSLVDFLGKLEYQILPGSDDGLVGLKNNYWATICLTAGSLLICSFAIISGRESFYSPNFSLKLIVKVCIPAITDLFVIVGRYVGLVFLPAAVVSILYNGLQLLFIAIFRWLRGRYMGKTQWFGLAFVAFGLIVVGMENFFSDDNDHDNNSNNTNNKENNDLNTMIGLIIMLVVGITGAIRNTIEEILLKEYDLHSHFIVGLESILALIFLFLIVIGLIDILPLFTNNLNTNWNDIGPAFTNAIKISGVFECGLIFFLVIYGKETMQMNVTKLSCAMTRKLFQQLYPIGVWIVSLIMYYFVSNKYGENWNLIYSWVRLFGFLLVLYGTNVYMKPPKSSSKTTKKSKLERKNGSLTQSQLGHHNRISRNSDGYAPGQTRRLLSPHTGNYYSDNK